NIGSGNGEGQQEFRTSGRAGRGGQTAAAPQAFTAFAPEARGDRAPLRPPASEEPRAEGRARLRQPVYAAGRRGALGAIDRRRGEPRNEAALRESRHAAEDAGARRGGCARGD